MKCKFSMASDIFMQGVLFVPCDFRTARKGQQARDKWDNCAAGGGTTSLHHTPEVKGLTQITQKARMANPQNANPCGKMHSKQKSATIRVLESTDITRTKLLHLRNADLSDFGHIGKILAAIHVSKQKHRFSPL